MIEPGQEYRRARDSRYLLAAQLLEELLRRLGGAGHFAMERIDSEAPGGHDDEDEGSECQWNPATLPDLQEVGREECEIDDEEGAAHRNRAGGGPSPSVAHDLVQESGGQQHGG